MTDVEVGALKNLPKASRLEVQSEQRNQTLISLADFSHDVTACFMTVRTKLLSLHHRSGLQLVQVEVVRAKEVMSPMMDKILETLS